MPIFDTTPSKGSGGAQGGGTTYTAGNGIKIENDVISVNLLSASDNATGIVDGKLYTPVNNLITVKPLIIIQTNPVTPNAEVTFTFGEENIMKRTDEAGKAQTEVSRLGIWSITVNFGDRQVTKNLAVNEPRIYEFEILKFNIFGVKWNRTSTTRLDRTDGAANFVDPNPALNNGTGSSPFDTIQPWAGMVRVEDKVAGTLVAIPKYYFKITDTDSEFGIQISPEKIDGFMVSPAHMDRGDGQGERDVVYVGRYICNSAYTSKAKTSKQLNISRSQARSEIHSKLGSEYWQFDYATWWTINMLYLVEFADWNSQKVIGYGSSTNNTNGFTDEMKYHTGTDKEVRTSYGYVQYRNIEGVWNNPLYWVDGINKYGGSFYVSIVQSQFNDFNNSSYKAIGSYPSSGYITSVKQSENTETKWAIYPDKHGGDSDLYIPDYMGGSDPCICTGGWTEEQESGLFQYYTTSSGYSTSNYGCRLIKLPNKQ